MDFLYLSTLCSKKEYQRMFETYGTTSSHASQKFNRLLLKGLNSNGINVNTLTYRSIKKIFADDLKHSDELEESIKYKYIPHCKNDKFNRYYTILMCYIELCKWSKLHRDGIIGVDTINGELSISTILFKLTHKRNKTIGVVTDVPSVRAIENRTGLRSLPSKIKNALINKYDSYVFLTENMNELINKKNRPYVIMEGIVDDSFATIPNTLEGKYPEKVVMMVGLLEKEFGVEKLVDVFKGIDNPDAKLIIYGKGSSAEYIAEASKQDKRIEFRGETVNSVILEEETKATVLVNPRRNEGEWTKFSFPSKNIEYIASGTPMLAYNLPCIPDEYKDHFFEIDDDSFETVLKNCLEAERSILHEKGMQNRKWIIENKNPAKQTQRMADMMINKLSL